MMRRLVRTGIFPVLFFILGGALPLRAQYLVRSWAEWRTIETARFVFHYPAELEDWTRYVAARADAIDSSVARITGYAPPNRTHVVVDDPYNLANGSAWPFIDRPVISLWATPPDPREDIGEFRDWGPTLLSHEFTHVAHLSRPSRNPLLRTLWRLAPVNLGPVTLNAPRWVFEGFATYAEGRVTGSGRPHGAWRPAFLRQWALEGQLPRYEQLDNFGSFEGGEFAYLAGSAFLEWLAAAHGDASLVDVWRRMTARQPRGFDEAFTGVYGESARALYGRFTADLTGKSLEIQRAVRANAPGDTGAIVQRLSWSTGDPAVSRDGRRVAIELSSATQPSRIVVWSTAAEPDTMRARRDSALRARDPDDVPARPIYPPPKRALATLRATTGAAYEHPRFLADGRIVVSRLMRTGDGALRPDLFIWDPSRRTVSRITRGAALQRPDPLPDGRTALAMQCLHGWCDVALVDLATGRDSVILRGSPARSYFRPRISPDGRRFVVSMNESGRWRVVVIDRAGGAARELPFKGNAYDASWITAGGVVATSDADGIPNLWFTNLNDDSAIPLTGVTGAAVGAEAVARDSSVWFLSLHARGYDLRRVVPRPRPPAVDVALSPALRPAAMAPAVEPPPLALNAVSAPRPYALTPRQFRWLPFGQADADGLAAMLAFSSSDLVGRSELMVKAAAGDRAAWRGAAFDAAWKGARPFVRLHAFDAGQRLSASRSPIAGSPSMDARLRGALVMLDGSRSFESWSARYRAGASVARLTADSSTTRSLLLGDASAAWLQRFGVSGFSESMSTTVTIGNAFATRFHRVAASGSASAFGFTPVPVAVSASYARVSGDAPSFERVSLGGGAAGGGLVDRVLLSQRVSMPVLPSGIATGSSALTYRVSLTTQPVALYYWAGSATSSASFDTWYRVVGIEGSKTIGAIPVAGVPSARVVYGIGESLDVPFRNQVRGYLSVLINP